MEIVSIGQYHRLISENKTFMYKLGNKYTNTLSKINIILQILFYRMKVLQLNNILKKLNLIKDSQVI